MNTNENAVFPDNEVIEPRSVEEIKSWLTSYLAEVLEIKEEEVDPKIHFNDYGLDSELAIGLTGDLENWLGRKINPTLLYNYTNIESLGKHLAKEIQALK